MNWKYIHRFIVIVIIVVVSPAQIMVVYNPRDETTS